MFRSYSKSESGAFAIYAALIMMVVILSIGVALDLGRAQKLRGSLQDVADSAVLAAAKSRVKEQGAMQILANQYVAENDRTGLQASKDLTLSQDKKAVSIDMSGSYNTVLMKMFGKPTIPINVTARTLIEVTDYTDIVLILDTTASMGYENRMTSLKTATNGFLDVISDIDSDRIRVSVVPFAQYVNVGVSNRNQPWIDVAADWTEYRADSCSTSSPVIGQENCRTENYPSTPSSSPTYGTCYDDGVAYSCQTSSGSSGSSGGTKTVCDNIYGSPQTTCSPQSPIQHTWSGCVGSRTGNDNLKASYESGESKIPGLLDLSCSVPILALTTSLNTVKVKVSSMTTQGQTYGPAGLIWGWRMLDAEEPFADTRVIPNGANLNKVAIFMTDGDNTASRTGQTHDGTSRSDADDTVEELCERMKDEDINMYTVTFRVNDNQAKELVRDCASLEEQYYDADSASSLQDAFEDIGYSLLSPRLTH